MAPKKKSVDLNAPMGKFTMKTDPSDDENGNSNPLSKVKKTEHKKTEQSKQSKQSGQSAAPVDPVSGPNEPAPQRPKPFFDPFQLGDIDQYDVFADSTTAQKTKGGLFGAGPAPVPPQLPDTLASRARQAAQGFASPFPRRVDAQNIYPPSACVFVANLPATYNDRALELEVARYLERFGRVFVKVRRDPRNMPFGFCQFTCDDDAKAAVTKASGAKFLGRNLRVEMARAHSSWIVFKRSGRPTSKPEAISLLGTLGEIHKAKPLDERARNILRIPPAIVVQYRMYDPKREVTRAFAKHHVFRVQAFDPKAINRQAPVDGIDDADMLRQYDQDYRSAYFGNLPLSTSVEKLREFANGWGPVVKVDLRQKYVPSSRNLEHEICFAFVEFVHSETVDALCNALGAIRIDGHDIKVERKQWRLYNSSRDNEENGDSSTIDDEDDDCDDNDDDGVGQKSDSHGKGKGKGKRRNLKRLSDNDSTVDNDDDDDDVDSDDDVDGDEDFLGQFRARAHAHASAQPQPHTPIQAQIGVEDFNINSGISDYQRPPIERPSSAPSVISSHDFSLAPAGRAGDHAAGHASWLPASSGYTPGMPGQSNRHLSAGQMTASMPIEQAPASASNYGVAWPQGINLSQANNAATEGPMNHGPEYRFAYGGFPMVGLPPSPSAFFDGQYSGFPPGANAAADATIEGPLDARMNAPMGVQMGSQMSGQMNGQDAMAYNNMMYPPYGYAPFPNPLGMMCYCPQHQQQQQQYHQQQQRHHLNMMTPSYNSGEMCHGMENPFQEMEDAVWESYPSVEDWASDDWPFDE